MIGRWVGIGLIVLGWIQVIPLTLGWAGFGIALISFVMEAIYKKNLPPPDTNDNPGEPPAPNN